MPTLTNAYPRLSARRGQVVDLNVDFLHAGVLSDPFAIRHVEIYKTQVVPHNLMATIPISSPSDTLYPAPILREFQPSENGECCTEPTSDTVPIPGRYHLPYAIPSDFQAPDVYYDVWYYFAENPCGSDCDIDDPDNDPMLLRCCHQFFIYPDEWACNNNLQTIKFGFEPLDQRFYQPEMRPLEIGLMPLPLYSYNINLVNPMIPFLKPTITVETQHNELLIDNAACRIGIRQGPYRSNPFVIQYDLDTNRFLKGTYRYYITLSLPVGGTRVSKKFIFSIL